MNSTYISFDSVLVLSNLVPHVIARVISFAIGINEVVRVVMIAVLTDAEVVMVSAKVMAASFDAKQR